jgi:hypothetical protein
VYKLFDSILFSKSWIREWFLDHLGIRYERDDKDGHNNLHFEYNSTFFLSTFKALVGIFTSSILLSPVAILYLVPLSKGAAFAVIVTFLLAFVITMVIADSRVVTMLFGLCAFMAVLVNFLSNVMENVAFVA